MNLTITDVPFSVKKKSFSYTEFRKIFLKQEKESLYADFLDFHELPVSQVTAEQRKKGQKILQKPLSDLVNI